ncbi:MAG TPA: NAD-dependent epimerase/dehydratase family protein [Thermoleophilaceae bacterium]|nr:NAD-dependent epimerase/dehydratase family protein [Thermoleophilaceae bacterium]
MTTAFVTGGSGFIGRALLRRLTRDGWTVRALARSDASAAAVEAQGAEPVRGELSDVAAMRAGADGAEVAFHLAAKLGDSGPWEEFQRGTVEGTDNALAACREAGLRRFVHTGTEAALMDGQPLTGADETWPLKTDSPAWYPRSKARAEKAVLAANADGFETVALRPRFVWGVGDTTLLPVLSEMVRKGRFAWIGGGTHRTSTTHVDNTVEGLLLAAEKGRPGEAYFVTDGPPVVFRDFLTRMLATQGVPEPTRSVPLAVAKPLSAAAESAWRALPLPGDPPLTRFAVWASGLECTIDDSKARSELGYAPVVSVEDGLAGLASASGSP